MDGLYDTEGKTMIAVMPAFGETSYAIWYFAAGVLGFMLLVVIIILAISMINNLLK